VQVRSKLLLRIFILLDVFSGDAFSTLSMTSAIEILPLVPNVLGGLGLFQEEGVATTSVALENKGGRLSLIPNQPRGSRQEVDKSVKRKVRNFMIPHLPFDDVLMADSVQNVRAFGSNDSLASVASVVNSKLAALKADHEATWEYHRAGALVGNLLDADGSTVIYNIFTEFGISETAIAPMVAATAGSVSTGVTAAAQAVDDAVGSQGYSGIMAVCSPTFFDLFVRSADIKAAYDKWQDGAFLRQDQRISFEYGGIKWMRYSQKFGANTIIPANTARIVVQGIPGLFKRFNGPADFVEAVNTIGKPIYAKQEPMRMGKGIDIHTQSNPLHICTQPQLLIKMTIS
jgi:hypothetical protein